jgi:late competence protein required for DNA uptake (superfamily II DNA/RNA helicase)
MDKKDKIVYEELDYGIKKINSWYKKKVKSLSILTIPFNSSLVFVDIILEVVRQKEKVLYVWSRDGEIKELIERLKLIKKDITYGYTEDGTGNCDIMFLNYKNVLRVRKICKLVIFDDVSDYSSLNKYNLKGSYEYVLEVSERSILYTVEPAITIGEKFELTNIRKGIPFVEPRIITTRIDLNKDIPYILYDYLKWFRDEKKKVVIFVPNKDKLEIVYEYYIDKLKMDGVKISKFSKNDEKKYINSGLKIKEKAIFIITDYMEVSLEGSKFEAAIILFADSDKYSYKDFIYLCGNLSRMNNEIPEVLLISKDISDDMEKAKDMARDFNKRIWKRNFMSF